MKELWVELNEDLPCRYLFSNLGACVSLERIVKWSNGYPRVIRGRRLKCEAKVGYPCYSFSLGKGYQKRISIHLLIARYFIPNPFNLPFVNHIDKDIFNYKINNLEWCTQSENIKHGKSKETYSIRDRFQQPRND